MIGLLALTLTDIDLIPFNPARYHQALVNLLNLTTSIAPETINFSKFYINSMLYINFDKY
jgi:hypothetical protein